MGTSKSADEQWKEEDVLRELYLEQGLCDRENGEELGCSRKNVSYWREKFGIEGRDPSEITKDVDLTPSCDLLYLIGVGIADASLSEHDGAYTISLTVDSEKFTQAFSRAMNSIGIPTNTCNDRGYLKTEGRRKALHSLIHDCRDDCEHISGLWNDSTQALAFVRGFYDSEGHDRGKSRGLNMYNTRIDYLEFVQEILANHNITSWFTTSQREDAERDTVYVLYVPHSDKHLFIDLISPNIKRNPINRTLSDFP